MNEWQQRLFCDEDVGLEGIIPASVEEPKKAAQKKKFAKKKAVTGRRAKKNG